VAAVTRIIEEYEADLRKTIRGTFSEKRDSVRGTGKGPEFFLLK
jgi:hypothetical protein